MAQVYATADIGSNTVHLLIAEVDRNGVQRIDNRSEWVGLGETVAMEGRIPKEGEQLLVQLLGDFKSASKGLGAKQFYVFATEAVRAAENHKDVLSKIKKETGVEVDVISPRTEAEFGLRGALLDTPPRGEMTLFEIGGGSAQVAQIKNEKIANEFSLPLGTGKLFVETGIESPSLPEEVDEARRFIQKSLKEVPPLEWSPYGVGSGGVARGIWRALHPDGEATLALEEIQYLVWATARAPVDRLALRFGCKYKRAATLLPGALVYEELMKHMGLTEISISEYGVREGAVLAIAAGLVGV